MPSLNAAMSTQIKVHIEYTTGQEVYNKCVAYSKVDDDGDY